MPYTIIAGTAGPRGRRIPFGLEANDWIVAVEETKVRPGARPVTFPVGHTFMMNDHRVHAVIRRALGAVGGEPFSRHDADEHSILGVS